MYVWYAQENTNEKLEFGRVYYNEGKKKPPKKDFLLTCTYTNDDKGDGVTLKFL